MARRAPAGQCARRATPSENEECLDVLGLDPVLPVLGSVAGIPIEILPTTLKTVQPRGSLLVIDEPHSYCIAMRAKTVKPGARMLRAARREREARNARQRARGRSRSDPHDGGRRRARRRLCGRDARCPRRLHPGAPRPRGCPRWGHPLSSEDMTDAMPGHASHTYFSSASGGPTSTGAVPPSLKHSSGGS